MFLWDNFMLTTLELCQYRYFHKELKKPFCRQQCRQNAMSITALLTRLTNDLEYSIPDEELHAKMLRDFKTFFSTWLILRHTAQYGVFQIFQKENSST